MEHSPIDLTTSAKNKQGNSGTFVPLHVSFFFAKSEKSDVLEGMNIFVCSHSESVRNTRAGNLRTIPRN